MKIKGVLIDIDNKKVSVEEIDDDVSTIKKIISATVFTVARRKIGSYFYAIICDDGWLMPIPYNRVSAVSLYDYHVLVGNLFICKEYGPYLKSLTKAEIEQVKLAIRHNRYDASPVLIME